MSVSFAIAERDAVDEPSLEVRVGERDPSAIDEVYREHHAALRGFARALDEAVRAARIA